MPAVSIRTERLWLRPFVPADLDALHAIFVDPDVRRYLCDGRVMPRSWVEEVIDQSVADFASSVGLWSVALEEGGVPVGFAGYREFHDPPVRELLYGLSPGHWGTGLAGEAAQAAVRYGFERIDLDPIPASIDAPNEASIRLIGRLGFRETHRGPGPKWEQVHFELARSAWKPEGGRFEVSLA